MQNEHVEKKWNARFKELLDYRSQHGDCNVPQKQGKLGMWVNIQRRAYNAGSLVKSRIARLSSIGFKWTLKEGGPKVPWETRFDELVQYKAKHGDCNVPQKHGKLGTWANSQRKDYKTGSLALDRIDRLSGIGFKWTLKEGGPIVPWETRFNELIKYKAKHGDCNVLSRQGPLGRWVHTQRKGYKKNKLSQDRIDRLNVVGFDWMPPRGAGSKERPWEIRFNELVQYKAKHGDCNVPRSRGQLGRWVHNQREKYKTGKLSQDRIDRLNGIGFDCTPPRGRKSYLPGSRIQLLLTKEKVPITNVKSPSTGDKAMVVEPDKVEGEGFDSEALLPLQQIQSSKYNHKLGTESDDEVEEIGAWIYDQVMRKRGESQCNG